MASKYKRTQIGSVVKSKDPNKPNYLKFNLRDSGSLTVKDGQTFSVESKQFQLKSLSNAVADGKISEEVAGKIRERIEKIPEFILGEVILVEKN